MNNEQCCTLCGAGGHLAADCQWGHAIAGDILAKLPQHAAGRTSVENILDVKAAIRETELGHRSYADIDEALLNVEYDLSFVRCSNDMAGVMRNVRNAQMSLIALRSFLRELLLQRDNALAELANLACTTCEGFPSAGNSPCSACGRRAEANQDSAIAMLSHLLEWNRRQPKPPIAIGLEYWVAQEALRMARAAMALPSSEPTLRASIDVAPNRFEGPVTELPLERELAGSMEATDGGRSPLYEGLFDGETADQRHERIVGALRADVELLCEKHRNLEHTMLTCERIRGETIIRLRNERDRAQAGLFPQAWLDVHAERRRQVEEELWTPEHDDEHDGGKIAEEAAGFLMNGQSPRPSAWCWKHKHPDSPIRAPRRRQLVIGVALGLAEIERLDRAAARQPEGCRKAPAGWKCTRSAGHEGPCAAEPTAGDA
ncbi:hypothetical protein D3C78_361420 [compost metagenome]